MNEHLTSNEYTAFPFRDSAQGIAQVGTNVSYSTPTLPANAFVDLAITYYGGEQLYLKSITQLGPDYLFSFGTAGETLVNGAVTGLPEPWSMVAFQNNPEGLTCRAVAGSGLAAYLQGLTGTVEFGITLPIVESCLDTKPQKLINVEADEQYLTDIVGLLEGYNIDIDYDQTTEEITFSAIPGAGNGLYNPCEDAEPLNYIASVNGKRSSTSGGMLLGGSGQCYRYIFNPATGSMQLVNDCIPCCSCGDYERYANYLNLLLERVSELQSDIYESIAFYNTDVTYFNDVVIPYLSGVRIYGQGRTGHVEKYNDKYLMVTITIHNISVERQITVEHVFDETPVVKDSWLTIGDVTAQTDLTSVIVLPKNQTAVYTFMIERGTTPPSSVTTTANWTEDAQARQVLKTTEWN